MNIGKHVILDANLAVLYVVGVTSLEYIPKHKRLRAYDKQDFFIVSDIVGKSCGILFTPNILSETSNLIRHIGDPIKTEISITLAAVVATSKERYVESKLASKHTTYNRLGITDAVLLTLLESEGVLLTADLDLYLAASQSNLNVTNYNHIRRQRSDFE